MKAHDLPLPSGSWPPLFSMRCGVLAVFHNAFLPPSATEHFAALKRCSLLVCQSDAVCCSWNAAKQSIQEYLGHLASKRHHPKQRWSYSGHLDEKYCYVSTETLLNAPNDGNKHWKYVTICVITHKFCFLYWREITSHNIVFYWDTFYAWFLAANSIICHGAQTAVNEKFLVLTQACGLCVEENWSIFIPR